MKPLNSSAPQAVAPAAATTAKTQDVPTVRIEVTESGGRQFVSGLAWKSLTSAVEYKKEAKLYGRANRLEMVAIREYAQPGRKRQAGFAPRIQRKRLRMMYSLAAVLADTLGADVIAAFKVGDERYVLVAVRGGGILRDRFGDRSEVETLLRRVNSQFQGDIAKNDLQRENVVLIAPEEFGIFDDNRTLADVLPKRPRRADRLQTLEFGKLTRGQALALGGALFAVSGAYLGADKWMALRQQAADQAQALMDQRAAEQQRQDALASMPKPWEDNAKAAILFQACNKVADAAPLSIGGWNLQEITCALPGQGSNGLVYVRADTDASLESFARGALASLGPEFEMRKPDEAVVPVHLELAKAGAGELGTLQGAERRFVSRMQERSDVASFTLVAPEPAVAPADGQAAPAPWWTEKAFTVESDLPGDMIFDGYEDAGLVAQSVVMAIDSNANLKWTIKGEIYGK